MGDNPWGAKLRKTSYNTDREAKILAEKRELEERQNQLKDNNDENASKNQNYKERQASLASDAFVYGLQDRYGQGGKRKSRRYRKITRKHRKTRKTRRYKK